MSRKGSSTGKLSRWVANQGEVNGVFGNKHNGCLSTDDGPFFVQEKRRMEAEASDAACH